jgi:hypothetical protein
MVMRLSGKKGILAAMITAGFLYGTLHIASAADETKAAQTKTKPEQSAAEKKPKAKTDSKAAKPGSPKPTYKTAETANKGKSCFGEAPTIIKLSPDEGKAGDQITITGTKFGSAECLRSISFGPGNPAKYTVKNETTITTTVPKGGRKGLALVTVTTASGEDSKSFLVK